MAIFTRLLGGTNDQDGAVCLCRVAVLYFVGGRQFKQGTQDTTVGGTWFFYRDFRVVSGADATQDPPLGSLPKLEHNPMRAKSADCDKCQSIAQLDTGVEQRANSDRELEHQWKSV